jgi:hypothetical protein
LERSAAEGNFEKRAFLPLAKVPATAILYGSTQKAKTEGWLSSV